MSIKKKNYNEGEMRPLGALNNGVQQRSLHKDDDAETYVRSENVRTVPVQEVKTPIQVKVPSKAQMPQSNAQSEVFTEEDRRELMSEMNIAEKPAKKPVRRGSTAPDLTDKASRDAYFSRYTSAPSERVYEKPKTPQQIRIEETQAILKEEAKKRAERERLNHVPFTGPLTRPVVSHMKPDVNAETPISQNEDAEELQATAEMRETIEGMMQKQRAERESAREDAENAREMKGVNRNWDVLQIAIVIGTLVICAVKMLFK